MQLDFGMGVWAVHDRTMVITASSVGGVRREVEGLRGCWVTYW